MNFFDYITLGGLLVLQVGAFMYCVELYIDRMLRRMGDSNGDGSLRV